ncbi:MAG: dihydroorotase [SAR202 cluster bacterium]|nr:dihydroorotase [SAR202 cluster bacterium]
MGVLIRNGRVLDPSRGFDEPADVLILEGRIAAVDRGIPTRNYRVLDASDQIVCPGFIDVHVHLREPGQEYKETIATGTRAAAAGGFAHVCCMPNTDPAIDDPAVVSRLQEKSAQAIGVRVHVLGAMSKANAGQELSEMGRLADSGVALFSDDAFPIQSTRLMRRAMEYARGLHRGVSLHCEDKDLAGEGVMNEGEVSTLLGLRGIPGAAEDIHVARNIELCRLTGCRLHILHVSTRVSVDLVRRAKRQGLPVTAEGCPHHFCLTDEACLGYNTQAKVNPPLRSRDDMEAVLEGLADGTLDCIATDHAPHAIQEKDCEFDEAMMGLTGLETCVPLTLDRLVHAGVVSLAEAVAKLTVNPARVLVGDGRHLPPGVEAGTGTLQIGAPGDVTVLDLERTYRVAPERLQSRSKNTPFGGWELKGAATATVVGGRVLMENGALTE